VVTWLNASFEMRFRLIGGLTVRFAASEDHGEEHGGRACRGDLRGVAARRRKWRQSWRRT